MSWAQYNGTFGFPLDLFYLLKLSLIDNNLIINAPKELDHDVAHGFECSRLDVGHDDINLFLGVLLNFFEYLALLYLQLELPVVFKLFLNDLIDRLFDRVSLHNHRLHVF